MARTLQKQLIRVQAATLEATWQPMASVELLSNSRTPAPHNDLPALGVAIGVRLRAEIRLRIRELQARCPSAQAEPRELAGLHELLKLPRKEY